MLDRLNWSGAEEQEVRIKRYWHVTLSCDTKGELKSNVLSCCGNFCYSVRVCRRAWLFERVCVHLFTCVCICEWERKSEQGCVFLNACMWGDCNLHMPCSWPVVSIQYVSEKWTTGPKAVTVLSQFGDGGVSASRSGWWGLSYCLLSDSDWDESDHPGSA